MKKKIFTEINKALSDLSPVAVEGHTHRLCFSYRL
jgi:hypothetical protein